MRKTTLGFIFFCLFWGWASPSFGHDTDLYMSSGEGVEPNILILFDNSGSMNEQVQTRYYDPNVDYDPLTVPLANKGTVYRKSGSSWIFFANSIADVACAAARTALTNYGNYTGNTNASCSGTSRTLRTGNYRNYIASGGDQYEVKLSIAKRVITDFLNTINGVRLGAMVFNYEEGGRIQTTVKSLTDAGRAQLITDINNIVASTWTPLSETLYEIGLYFKGGSSYFNAGVQYVSPIQYACQRNYVIIITDGEPTHDQNNILRTVVGDRDGDQREPIGAANDPHYADSGSDYLDDVAKYLYDSDLRADLTGKQNIITYTIGFTIHSDLLERTAAAGHGKYYYSQNAQQLSNAFQNIIDEILAKTSSFVAPVVPVDRMEKTSSGNNLYIALFKPVKDRMWSGNIKKYRIANADQPPVRVGDILDANGILAVDSANNQFFEAIRSYWTPSGELDGGDAEKGGVGEVLMNRNFTTNPRKIYTYLGSNASLTHSSNAFTGANITPAMLGLGTDTSARDKLISFVYGYDAYDDDGNGITNEKRDWILGSFLHSKPFIVHYDAKDVIFAGGNDGMLHAFDDTNGEELWAFIPPNLLPQLQALHSDLVASFVDGSPRAYISRNADGTIQRVILIFGERRGGNRYYALDVTSFSSPTLLWEINPDAADSAYVKMGQSWSTPIIGKVASGTGEKWVAFVAGGYDTGQDNDIAPASDSVGTAVYVVDIFNGSLVKSFTTGMTFSIPSDMAKVDTDDDGRIDKLYVGDMGGQLWKFDLKDPNPTNWSAKIIFTAPAGAKIFYPPEVTLEQDDFEMLFFGTGDREHPKETLVANRLYAIKDKNPSTPLTEGNLYDATSDELQASGITEARKAEILNQLKLASGWVIQLGTGEKCLSPAIVFNRVANFTTFTPGDQSGGSDPCFVGEGGGKLYLLDYLTAVAATFNLKGEEVILPNPSDRVTAVGSGIPSGGVVAVLSNGTIMEYIGIGGGIYTRALGRGNSSRQYWKIVF